jgi:hypothetical protein
VPPPSLICTDATPNPQSRPNRPQPQRLLEARSCFMIPRGGCKTASAALEVSFGAIGACFAWTGEVRRYFHFEKCSKVVGTVKPMPPCLHIPP